MIIQGRLDEPEPIKLCKPQFKRCIYACDFVSHDVFSAVFWNVFSRRSLKSDTLYAMRFHLLANLREAFRAG
jgi:hypothetical protein